MQKFSVPLKIGIANEFSFGKINLLGTNFRTDVIKNEFPFPIQLKNIHILVLNNSNGEMVPCIYTWTLGNKEVLSHSRIRIDANAIPIWMDRSELVKKIWIEYSLLPCNECSESVINTITSSKSNDRERKIVINSMGILKKFNATLMKITLRSRFLDANNTVSKEQTITIDRDNSEFELGPLYIWNERDLSYEYKITLINDEKTYTGLGWIASKDFELYINKDVVKRSLGANCPPGN